MTADVLGTERNCTLCKMFVRPLKREVENMLGIFESRIKEIWYVDIKVQP
jgi:hypothetical protein